MNEIDFDVIWGGAYATKSIETGKYRIFRLIDFNRDAYHSAMFKEEFDEIPSLKDVLGLSPFIRHVPIDSRGLLNRPELQLIGSLPVDRSFFNGYSLYLRHFGASNEEIDELVVKLIGFSKKAPLHLRLRIVDDELHIENR